MFLNLLPRIIFDSSADVLHPFLVYEASIVLNQTSCGDLLSATLQTTTGDPWKVSNTFTITIERDVAMKSVYNTNMIDL